MSLYVFVGLCVVGVDVLIYILLQWMYGDTRRALAKKLEAQRSAMSPQRSQPFVVASHPHSTVTRQRLQKVKHRLERRTA